MGAGADGGAVGVLTADGSAFVMAVDDASRCGVVVFLRFTTELITSMNSVAAMNAHFDVTFVMQCDSPTTQPVAVLATQGPGPIQPNRQWHCICAVSAVCWSAIVAAEWIRALGRCARRAYCDGSQRCVQDTAAARAVLLVCLSA